MASKYSHVLNTIEVSTLENSTLNKLDTLSSETRQHILNTANKNGWTADYDDKKRELTLKNPDDEHQKFVFKEDFLLDSGFDIVGENPSKYSLDDLFKYQKKLHSNLKGRADHIEFIGAEFTADGRPILGSWSPNNNTIYINTNNLKLGKSNPQNLEYTFNHESTHALDWDFRSSNRITSFLSKHKEWRDLSDNTVTTSYAQLVKNSGAPAWRRRAEDLAEVNAYVQLARTNPPHTVPVPTPNGNVYYEDWVSDSNVSKMVKLADEFTSNPMKYVQKHLSSSEAKPIKMK